MTLKKDSFGKLPDGREAFLYTLTSVNNLEVKITNYGGIITSIKTPDRNGNFNNIVLGFDKFENYLKNDPYLGALVGRVANRISNARFELGGKVYQLKKNEGANHLHGGGNGFEKALWDVDVLDDMAIRLNHVSRDGDAGYPGNLNVTATYSLSDDNKLSLEFDATSDQETPVNFTAHSYFNLTGNPSEAIYNHKLKLNADSYTPTDEELIPTGAIKSVEGTPLDFRKFKPIGKDIGETDIGYDNNFVLNSKNGQVVLAAEAEEPESGRTLKVYTSMPCMQLYTANYLDGTLKSPDGIPFLKHGSFCLEPQHYPDAVNRPEFPSVILSPDKPYKAQIVYEFL
jgi:aldose 1-epimerase